MQCSFPGIQRPIMALLAVAGLMTLAPVASRGSSIVYYTSRTTFDAAEPGLPLEAFQPINSPAVIAAPLSSTTNNSDFVAGSILPGIKISNTNPALSAKGLFVQGSSVASNYFEDPLILSFALGVSAVGADFFASSGGASWAGTFTADLYNGTTFLAAPNFTEVAGGTSFLGFSSTTPVTSFDVSFQPTTDVDWAPHVENIAFGSPAPATVPEPSSANFVPSLLLSSASASQGAAAGRSHP